MATDPKPPRPEREPDEVSDEVLDWIAGGAHGCPACPHPALTSEYQTGGHILVDGSIFKDGVYLRKL
jgi:hypothetical protein